MSGAPTTYPVRQQRRAARSSSCTPGRSGARDRPACSRDRLYSPFMAHYAPMIPSQVKQPFHRSGWIYEEKIDGWRMLAYKDGRTVRLESRNGVDHTRRFPDVASAVAALPHATLVADGA